MELAFAAPFNLRYCPRIRSRILHSRVSSFSTDKSESITEGGTKRGEQGETNSVVGR